MNTAQAVIELDENGATTAEIANQLQISRTYVRQLRNRPKKRGSAWRRQTKGKIERLLAGADPAQRRMVLDALGG